MKFSEKLATAWKTTNSLVCVGLDPEPKKFPDKFRDTPGAIFEFNKAIVDATRDLVCAYKPQFAHYAAHAAETANSARFDKLSHKLMCACGCVQLLGECNHMGCPDLEKMSAQLAASVSTATMTIAYVNSSKTVEMIPARPGVLDLSAVSSFTDKAVSQPQ